MSISNHCSIMSLHSSSSSNTSSSLSSGGNLSSPSIVVSSIDYDINKKEIPPAEYCSIKVTTPNFTKKIEKTFDFNLENTVWRAKQDVLVNFAQCPELKDALNFGFYMPPYGGRAGKFLDEERILREYITNRTDVLLEFRYKRRIFRHLQLTDEKKLQKINTKKHRKKFIEFITLNSVEEVSGMLEKGLDPNYHDEKSGDTPLIIASLQENCEQLLKLMVMYGAYLDFRSEAGYTALHNVSMIGKLETLKILLDLGASPNYKDSKGLTPLYYSITTSSNPLVTELLLNDHAEIGIKDIHGIEEIHQACKLGHIQNLEHLIYYGADVNSRTASGSTPLHICSLENRESCARVLLFRGANKNILNFAGQSAYDVAVVSNHFEIAAVINEFNESDVKRFADKPIYSKRRRTKSLKKKSSIDDHDTSSSKENTSSSEPSSPRQLQHSTSEGDVNMLGLGKLRKLSGHNSARKSSTHSLPNMLEELSESDSDSDEEEGDKIRRRPFVNAGVGTKRSPAPMKINPSGPVALRNRLYSSIPGRQFVAISDYEPQQAGELALENGDIVEVLYVGEQGFWEGRVRGRAGWFPSYCVQETKKGKQGKKKERSWFGKKSSPLEIIDKAMKVEAPKERLVTLKKGDKGYGFQLRGANAHTPHIEFVPTPQYPALQYIGEVDKGGVADKAGLKAGDFVLEINEENVITATHSFTVTVIAKGKEELRLKVITVAPETVSPELIQPNGTLRSKDVKEVKGYLKENGLVDELQKKPKPPPPARSSSTTLTSLTNDNEFFADGSIDTNSETVVLDNGRERRDSVKGMWAGSAFKLSGNEAVIREDDISTGMGRKQKGVSSDLAKEFDEKFKMITKPCLVDASHYPPVKPKPPREDPSKLKKVSSGTAPPNAPANPTRKKTPPGYEYTLESLRRGRANSIGKGDNGRPTSMIVTSNTQMEYEKDVALRKNSKGVPIDQNNINNRHSMFVNSADDMNAYNQRRVNNYLEQQQFATLRSQNRQKQPPPNSYNDRKDPRMNGRPKSAVIDRDYNQRYYQQDPRTMTMDPRMDPRQLDPRFAQMDPRLANHDPYRTLPTRMDNRPPPTSKKPETVLQAHQRRIVADEQHYRQGQLPPPPEYYPGKPTDGLLRLQNERIKAAQTQKTPSHTIAPPAPSPAQSMPAPPPPPPPPDYLDPPPPIVKPVEDEIKETSPASSSVFEDSIASAAAARSERIKTRTDDQIDKAKHEHDNDSKLQRIDGSTGSETLSLYNSSSSVSLDSTCSKDSGCDNSLDNVDHSSALAQAIALRAAKLSTKETTSTVGNLPTTVEEPEQTKTDHLMKPGEINQRGRCVSDVTPRNEHSDEDKGYSSPTSVYRPRAASSNPPPTTKPKPKRNISKTSDKNNNLSEDICTNFLDGVIADAEASIDYDLISISSSSSLPDEDKKSVLQSKTIQIPAVIEAVDDEPLELPPPPMEFLDEFTPDATSEEKTTKTEVKVTTPVTTEPPPPYSRYKSDSTSSEPVEQNYPQNLSGKSYFEWTVNDVCMWLDYLELSQYRDTFTDNDIEGKHLPELSKDELKELGIKKLGHRMTLDDAISKLCRDT